MRYIFFVYQWFIAGPIIAIATILAALSATLFSVLGFRSGGYYPSHYWARLFCYIMFVRVEVKGRENIDKNTSYVFVANHQGAYDIFSIYGFLNHTFYWMMKKSLERIPFVGFACKASGHIMVDNSSAKAVKHTMEIAKSRLCGGHSLVVFPEGARSWTGKMRKFKRGAFVLAQEFGLPVVPITIDGSFKVLPRTTYNIKPGKITLTIHEPIDITKEGIDATLSQSFAEIEAALTEADRNS